MQPDFNAFSRIFDGFPFSVDSQWTSQWFPEAAAPDRCRRVNPTLGQPAAAAAAAAAVILAVLCSSGQAGPPGGLQPVAGHVPLRDGLVHVAGLRGRLAAPLPGRGVRQAGRAPAA